MLSNLQDEDDHWRSYTITLYVTQSLIVLYGLVLYRGYIWCWKKMITKRRANELKNVIRAVAAENSRFSIDRNLQVWLLGGKGALPAVRKGSIGNVKILMKNELQQLAVVVNSAESYYASAVNASDIELPSATTSSTVENTPVEGGQIAGDRPPAYSGISAPSTASNIMRSLMTNNSGGVDNATLRTPLMDPASWEALY